MNTVTMNGHRRLDIKWFFTDMVDLAGWYVIEYGAGGLGGLGHLTQELKYKVRLLQVAN